MRGDWAECEDISNRILEMNEALRTAQSHCTSLLARIGVRRGTPGTGDLIADAIERAEFSQEAQRLGPAYLPLAEKVWLDGDIDDDRVERALEVMELCMERGNAWAAGESVSKPA